MAHDPGRLVLPGSQPNARHLASVTLPVTTRRTFHRRIYWRVLKRQRLLCGECGLKLSRPYEFDHILPLWVGGKDEPENLQAIHGECHKIKTAKEATDRAKMKRIQRKHSTRTGQPDRRPKWKSRFGSTRWKRKVDGTVVRR